MSDYHEGSESEEQHTFWRKAKKIKIKIKILGDLGLPIFYRQQGS